MPKIDNVFERLGEETGNHADGNLSHTYQDADGNLIISYEQDGTTYEIVVETRPDLKRDMNARLKSGEARLKHFQNHPAEGMKELTIDLVSYAQENPYQTAGMGTAAYLGTALALGLLMGKYIKRK